MVAFVGILSVLPGNTLLVTSEADDIQVFFIGWFSVFSPKCIDWVSSALLNPWRVIILLAR
jgi:hypothetical protein